MMQRLIAQLPVWMRPDHPMLRYALGNQDEISTGIRYRRVISISLLAALFLVSGYIIASDVFRENLSDQPISQMLSDVLFWPTFILQIILQAVVMFMTVNTIGEEKRRQTWDNLKATTFGAALTMRARWSAVVFYRMRGLIGLLLLVRLVLIAGILIDLTAFRGEYLNYLIGSITPQVPLPVGVLLLSLMMTASLLLPITALGFDTALGLFVSTWVNQRTYVTLAQISLTAIRIAIIIGLLFAVTQFRQESVEASNLALWLLLVGFAAIGDWGLSFLYLGFYGADVWASVPFGIFIGLAVLVYVLVQAMLTDGLLALATRRAEGSE